MTAAEAKTHLAEALREAESGAPVTITRYGRPVAVLVHPALLQQLVRLQAAGADGGLASLVGRYPDGGEFSEALDDVVAQRQDPGDPVDLG